MSTLNETFNRLLMRKILTFKRLISWSKTMWNQKKIKICLEFFSFLKSIKKNLNRWEIDLCKDQRNILMGAPIIYTIKGTKILIRVDVNEW